MSAFLCSDFHLSVIAHKAAPDNAQELANRLKAVNIHSVNFRYDEKTRKTKCKLAPATEAAKYTEADFIRLVQCWSYQSCEDGLNLDFIILDAYLLAAYTAEDLEASRNKSELWAI